MTELIVAACVLAFLVAMFFFMQLADEWPSVEISKRDRVTLLGTVVLALVGCGAVYAISLLGV